MAFSKELLDEILKDYHGPDDFYGPTGIMKQLTKALVERTMDAELTEHLGYKKHDQGEKPVANRRNGKTTKALRTDDGPMTIEAPRDREGSFEPQIVPKHQRDFKTDEVKERAAEWRSRPLEPMYPVLFLDALRVNIREGAAVVKKSVYLALAIRLDGQKELLGLWIEQTEGATFRMGIMNELKNRGGADILLAAVDGLTGFPEAIAAAKYSAVSSTWFVARYGSSRTKTGRPSPRA
jgi:transposase-like protein